MNFEIKLGSAQIKVKWGNRECRKIKYNTEPTAIKAAEDMNKKPTTRSILEPYLCYWCGKWHIGRAKVQSSK